MNHKLFLLIILLMPFANATTVSFFEEFPNEKSIDSDYKVYVAAKNLSEFYYWQERFGDGVYWIILEEVEGYWISPWSKREALERVFEEIKNREKKEKISVLLDLEPPLKRSMLFSFKEFFQNKKYIKEFVEESKDYNITVYTAEKGYISEGILKFFGLSYGDNKIKMYYTSYQRDVLPDLLVEKRFESKIAKFSNKGASVGIGLIAPGINNETKHLTEEELGTELGIIFGNNINEVVIYSLMGLDKEYKEVIEKELSGL